MADKMFGISMHDQRAKYLLIAVLAAILLAVVAWPGGATPVESAAASAARPQHHSAPDSGRATVETDAKAAAKTAAKTTGKKSLMRRDAAPLSEDELELTLKFNPFVPSPLLQAQLPGTQTAATEQQVQEELAEKGRVLAAERRLSEFRGQKVSVVFRTADGSSAALIGEKLVVREGQIIDGIRILSISANGVVVEAVPPP